MYMSLLHCQQKLIDIKIVYEHDTITIWHTQRHQLPNPKLSLKEEGQQNKPNKTEIPKHKKKY